MFDPVKSKSAKAACEDKYAFKFDLIESNSKLATINSLFDAVAIYRVLSITKSSRVGSILFIIRK